jgi:hypothetical protein
MRWVIVLVLAACATTDEECEPYIEYDHGYGPPDVGCRNLSFVGIPTPAFWYPTDTRARVNECQTRNGHERLFECEAGGYWRELPLYDPL